MNMGELTEWKQERTRLLGEMTAITDAAERAKVRGPRRTYTVVCEAKDVSGNAATATATVQLPPPSRYLARLSRSL